MPFKTFEKFYCPAKLKNYQRKIYTSRMMGGNHLGYKGTYLVPIQILGKSDA
jgi:hypothetical protein